MATKQATKQKADDKSPIINTDDPRWGGFGYEPSQQAREIVTRCYERYTELKTMRDGRFRYFNDMTLLELIDEASKRFNLYLRPQQDPEEWESRYVNPTIRNKTIAILARLASQRMKRFWFGVDNENKWKARIARVLDDAAAYKNADDQQFFFEMLTAIVTPKVISYEGFKAPQIKYYDIDGLDMSDPSNPNIKFTIKTKKDWNDVFSQIVPCEDFYPGNLRVHTVADQRMKDCGWESFMDKAEFDAEFSKYPNAQYVRNAAEMKQNPFFKEFLPGNLKDNQVWVFRYFKRPTNTPDQMVIMANGMLLTPEISPLPWNHKLKAKGLPFWDAGFEPYAADFYYDMPLAIKLLSDSDTTDDTMRMAINQLWLALNPPIITDDPENIEDKSLGPGVVYEVSNIDGTREMRLQGPNAQTANYLKMLASNMNLSSIDNISQGISGTANPTATEVDASQQAAMELLSLFLRFMEWAMIEKGTLRMSNQQQFYPLPLGSTDGKPEYRKFTVDNVPKILDGKTGSVKLTFVANKAALPPTPVLNPEQRIRLAENYGEDFDEIVVRQSPSNPQMEEVWVTAKFMRDFTAGCRIIPNSSVKISDISKKNSWTQFMNTIITAFPGLFDPKKLAGKTAEIYEQDAEELMLDQNQKPAGPQAPPGMEGLNAGLEQPNAQPTKPQLIPQTMR